jgi:hypothetical protein
MTAKTCALIIRHVIMKAQQYFKAPYDSEGNLPLASLLYLITQLENIMQEPLAVSMSLALINRLSVGPPTRVPAYAAMGAEDQLFGGNNASSLIRGTGLARNLSDMFQNIVLKNSGFEPHFQDLFQVVKR